MIKNIYAIYDEAVQDYSQHFAAENEKAAFRVLVPLVNNPDSYMSSQPKDFSLWHVGSFDTKTGVLSGTDTGKPIFLYEAMQVANQESNQ